MIEACNSLKAGRCSGSTSPLPHACAHWRRLDRPHWTEAREAPSNGHEAVRVVFRRRANKSRPDAAPERSPRSRAFGFTTRAKSLTTRGNNGPRPGARARRRPRQEAVSLVMPAACHVNLEALVFACATGTTRALSLVAESSAVFAPR